MTSPALIGISGYRQPADWGTWREVPADLLPAAYAQAVERVGGVPVLLPVYDHQAIAAAAVSRLDGLVLGGGADVNPARYGQTPDPHVTAWYDNRDQSELWLLAAANERALPVLGICRGMQLMAVAAGGSLIQHLPDSVGHSQHSGGSNEYGHAHVTVAPGHRISALLDPELIVPCHHHQAVATHPGFTATACDSDGVVQAMELAGDRFALAVQWHPEVGDDPGLFNGLVEAAQSHSNTPA